MDRKVGALMLCALGLGALSACTWTQQRDEGPVRTPVFGPRPVPDGAASVQVPSPEAPQGTPRMKLLSGLGTHSRPATTSSPLAKKYFDQGLILAFAFKFDDAMLSFTEATRLDPDFALAWWGIALCNGPHVHAPLVPPDQSKAAWDAILRALSLRYRTSPVEKDLIDALAARCSAPNAPGGAPGSGGVDRGTLDRAYAKEMKRLSITYPDDADVATLYAGSLLELVRWETYAPDGTPREQTPDIAKALDRALALDPAHPGANHLTIHAYEASPHPEKAAVAAQRLGLMVPCVCVPTLEAGQ